MSKETKKEAGEGPAIQQADTPKVGVVDLATRVKVKITKNVAQHFYEEGEVIECSPVLANKIVKNDWGKIITMIALILFASIGAYAQGSAFTVLKVHFPNADVLSDTITNTATGFVSTLTGSKNPAYTTTIQANIVKISGTVAGTVTLQGSNDNVYWNTATSGVLAITATYTVTDVATQSKSWVIVNAPYIYYRLTWTGTGTMSATLAGNVWSH